MYKTHDNNDNFKKRKMITNVKNNLIPHYMKFWRHVNLAIFRKFWYKSYLIFAISWIETLAKYGIQNFYMKIEHLCEKNNHKRQ